MKSTLKIAFVFCCFLGIASNAFAQKIGHLNAAELLNAVPAWKEAQTNLENFAAMLKTKLETQEKTLIDEFNKVRQQEAEGLLTPKQIEEKQKYFQAEQEKLTQAQTAAQQDLAKKEDDLTNPIRQKVRDAIAAVAKEKGYSYIIDLGAGSILHYEPEHDISAFVKAKM